MSEKNNTMKEIMKFALGHFEKKGYENVSVNDICTAMNISRTSFYSLFSGKKDLVLSIAREHSKIDNIDIAEIMALKNDFERMLHIYFFHINYSVASGVNFCKTLLKLELDEQLGTFDFSNAYNSLYNKLAANCQRDGIIRNMAPPVRLNMYAVQLAKALIFDWCRCNGDFDIYEESRRMYEEFLDVAPEYRKYK